MPEHLCVSICILQGCTWATAGYLACEARMKFIHMTLVLSNLDRLFWARNSRWGSHSKTKEGAVRPCPWVAVSPPMSQGNELDCTSHHAESITPTSPALCYGWCCNKHKECSLQFEIPGWICRADSSRNHLLIYNQRKFDTGVTARG